MAMPMNVPGRSLTIWLQEMRWRSLPNSATPAATPISVQVGTRIFSGTTSPSIGMAAAAPKPEAPRAA
jgi:hypothetical protein